MIFEEIMNCVYFSFPSQECYHQIFYNWYCSNQGSSKFGTEWWKVYIGLVKNKIKFFSPSFKISIKFWFIIKIILVLYHYVWNTTSLKYFVISYIVWFNENLTVHCFAFEIWKSRKSNFDDTFDAVFIVFHFYCSFKLIFHSFQARYGCCQ